MQDEQAVVLRGRPGERGEDLLGWAHVDSTGPCGAAKAADSGRSTGVWTTSPSKGGWV
jgi:hypothetical protein